MNPPFVFFPFGHTSAQDQLIDRRGCIGLRQVYLGKVKGKACVAPDKDEDEMKWNENIKDSVL